VTEGPPVDAGAVLTWMRGHGARLSALVAEETPEGADTAPAGDPAVRAHLRFLAEALAARAGDPVGPAARGLSADLPAFFDDTADLREEHLARGAGAIALEEHLQYGVLPGSDPSLDTALRRRLRLGAWTRLFLLALEERLGAAHDGMADTALAWTSGHQQRLARLIVAMDRQAKAAAGRSGTALDPATLDAIGQATVVQGHVRLLLEGLEAAFADPLEAT
jgi:hypothetical protein